MQSQGDVTGLVPRPVFKTATETPQAALVGSIPTRSRSNGRMAMRRYNTL
jgi:hypothetical protein